MAVRRKVFRIEERAQTGAPEGVSVNDAESTLHQREFMTELQALRALIESRAPMDREAMERARAQIAEAQAYKNEIKLIHAAVQHSKAELDTLIADVPDGQSTVSAGRELKAIVAGTDQATQSILQAAEEIAQAADTLSTALKGEHDRGLAQDIQDRVGQIFEACNFHDITGQRVAKVAATLKLVEDHMTRMLGIWHGVGEFNPSVVGEAGVSNRPRLAGPKLPGDHGHLTQEEIDAVFGYPL